MHQFDAAERPAVAFLNAEQMRKRPEFNIRTPDGLKLSKKFI